MAIYTTPQFSIDSHGAYVMRLTDSTGNPILFERTIIGDKRRGGAHVCLPYFGPDAAGVLPQHGIGRDVEWDVEVTEENEIICRYEEKDGELATGFRAQLLYSLGDAKKSFITSLIVANTFERKGPFPLTPGFHPYLAVDPKDVRLNGELVNLADFEPFKEFPNTPEMTIESLGRTITVSSTDLHHMVVWTDLRGDYLCVEPTLMGNAFDSTKPGKNILQTHDIALYGYMISWA